MLKPRPCVSEIRPYASPVSDPSFDLRLDLNESTTGCSPRVLARLRSLDAKEIALYPPREPGEKLAAEFLGIRPEETLLTNGADEGIDFLCRAYLDHDDEMIIVTPAFNMYEIFCQSAGARTVRVPAGSEFSFPAEAMLKAITPRTRLIIITNPNNPTGVAAGRQDMLRVIEAAPQAAVLLDEAYFDFHGQTLMDQIGKIPNLFIARTFSKAYGLAGMRIGILAGAGDQISVIRRIPSPFNLNVFALACLAEALADRETVTAYVDQAVRGRESLERDLAALGVKSWPSRANFVLADFGAQCDPLLEALHRQGIALRKRPDIPGAIRITIGTPREMERVTGAIRQFMRAPAAASQVAP